MIAEFLYHRDSLEAAVIQASQGFLALRYNTWANSNTLTPHVHHVVLTSHLCLSSGRTGRPGCTWTHHIWIIWGFSQR